MGATEADLRAVAAEHQHLSDRSRRLAVAGLTALLLLIYPFNQAVRRVTEEGFDTVADRVVRVHCVAEDEDGLDPDLSYVFFFFSGTCEKSEYAAEAALTGQAASERLEVLEREIESLARQWFALDYTLLGSRVALDLRYLILWVPVLFWLLGVYLYVLRVKMRLLERLARRQTDASEAATLVDRLRFTRHDGTTSYAATPRELETILFVAALAGLLFYLVAGTRPLWSRYDEPEVILVLAAVLCYYAVAYYWAARNRLLHHAEQVVGLPFRPGWPTRALRRASGWLAVGSRRVQRLVPGNLLVGSGLVLLTLVLTMSSACQNDETTYYTGWETLLGTGESGWFLSDVGLIFGSVYEPVTSGLGRGIYLASLVLALLTLAGLLAERSGTFRPGAAARRGMDALSGVVAVHVGCELGSYGFFVLLFLLRALVEEEEDVLALDGPTYWLLLALKLSTTVVPAVLWLRWQWCRPGDPSAWRRARNLLALVLAPSLLLALTLLGGLLFRHIGPLLLLVGVFLLRAGHAGQAEAATTATPTATAA